LLSKDYSLNSQIAGSESADGNPCVVYDVCFNRSVVETAMSVKRLKLFLINMALTWLGQKYTTKLSSGVIKHFHILIYNNNAELNKKKLYSGCKQISSCPVLSTKERKLDDIQSELTHPKDL
jgi:hypothetical protein